MAFVIGFLSILTEDIDHQDLIIDVDSNFARQLYKKWEKAVQVREAVVFYIFTSFVVLPF